MARPAHPLRQQLEAALLAHIAAHGDNFQRNCLVQEYMDRGVSQATIYRWIDAVLRRGRPSPQRASKKVSEAGHVPLPLPPAIVRALPRVPTIEDAESMGVVPVVELLRGCFQTARDLVKHSTGLDGKVRNARAMLAASEHMRRAIETADTLNKTVGIQEEMDQFHRIVMEEISVEPPNVQERILNRIRNLCGTVLAE